MGASITLAGESLIAQKLGAANSLKVVRFIFAYVPGLNVNNPVDRAAAKPSAGQIVHTYVIPNGNSGYVNPNQVVYSAQIGSDVGDWDFNWIGLETEENVLLAVAYVPTQQKRRNIPPLQIGNNLTRNFLVVFDGAQSLTGITIDAKTWQHDFTVRLAGIDERERLSNRDIYGRACFFGSALQLEKVGSVYQLKPGTAYVEGIRLVRSTALVVAPPAFPTYAWLDVALQRSLNDVIASWTVVWGAGLTDYVDSAGVQHYRVQIADLPTSAVITDRRPVENIAGPLVGHFAARTGDYAGLRARSTTKDDVGLGNLPNAKSDDRTTNSSDILASTKCVTTLKADLDQDITKMLPKAGGVLTGTLTEMLGETINASSATLDLSGPGNFFYINLTAGSQLITSLGTAPAGTKKTLFFTISAGASLSLQHNSAKIYLPGQTTIQVLHSDSATFRSVADGLWVCESYSRAQGGDFSGVGSVAYVAATTPPLGYLKCNGALVSRIAYASLFARIGTVFGAGDGATTFGLPDLRGEFLRGLDDGRGIDTGRSLGTFQLDDFKNHSHAIASDGYLVNPGTGQAVLTTVGTQSSTLKTGGTETRPRNVALLACIKY